MVFSNAVLHWIDRERQGEALEHIASALAPEGQFVFECGGRVHAALALAFERHGLAYKFPFYFPTIGEYAPLVEAAGMHITDAVLFDRPTALEGTDGMADWIRMFVKRPFEDVPAPLGDEIIAEAVEALRPDMFHGDTWYVDYVRLRIRAVKHAG